MVADDSTRPGPPDATATLPFPESLCHGCAAHRTVPTQRSLFILCTALPIKYPRQPIKRCSAFIAKVVALIVSALLTSSYGFASAAASSKRSRTHAPSPAGKAKITAASRKSKSAKPPPTPKVAPIPNPRGKVAVFLFDGDGASPLRARVVRLLRARGLKVTTTLRPVDSAEQYREMADTLGLAAFVDGEASEDGDQASVTVHIRSGVSGLRMASATLSGERRKLGADVDQQLWTQLGPPLARVCNDAAKPRKHEREPMRIEAGTPLDSPEPKGDLPKGEPPGKKGT